MPAVATARLLTDRPYIQGIALGGMPQGSPGMRGTNKIAPFEVIANSDETVTLVGRY